LMLDQSAIKSGAMVRIAAHQGVGQRLIHRKNLT
jgi:hypothetical protein